MAPPDHYSDLQVDRDAHLPEVAATEEKSVQTSQEANVKYPYYYTEPKGSQGPLEVVPANPPRRICGLRAKIFWTVLGIATMIIIAAVVGGAVGGVQAARSGSNSSESSESNEGNGENKPTPTSTEEIPLALTTVTQVGPRQTMFRDCPSSNDTIYSAIGSDDWQFRKYCNNSFRWTSGQNVINLRTKSLDECINRCVAYNIQNSTEIEKGQSSLCNGVCWRNDINDPDWPGQCFGNTIQNSSDTGFPFKGGVECDSAAWINQRMG